MGFLWIMRRLRKTANRFGIGVYKMPSFKNFSETINLVNSYTLTSASSIIALIESVKYVVNNNIDGSIVECGVWRGGSMMAVAKTLVDLNNLNKHLFLFDTFEGMTKPKDVDTRFDLETIASKKFKNEKTGKDSSNWVRASLDDVKNSVYSIGYDKEKIHFIKGKVEDSLPSKAPEKISVLRLDTDWYESTRHELIHLFPRLSKGGVIIIDDYDSWAGARKAMDEYVTENKIPLLLIKIPNGGRIGIKI